MLTWFEVFGIISILLIVSVCIWYGLTAKKSKRKISVTSKLQYLKQHPEIFALFLCINTGTSMDDKIIYDDNFQFDKIGF